MLPEEQKLVADYVAVVAAVSRFQMALEAIAALDNYYGSNIEVAHAIASKALGEAEQQ